MTFTSPADLIDEDDIGDEAMYTEQLLLDEVESVEGREEAEEQRKTEAKEAGREDEVGVVDEEEESTAVAEVEGANAQRIETEEEVEEEAVEFATPVTASAVSHAMHLDGRLMQCRYVRSAKIIRRSLTKALSISLHALSQVLVAHPFGSSVFR